MYIVVKPFRTVSRKFAADAIVNADDFREGPLALHDWVRLGFIKGVQPATAPVPVVPTTSSSS